MSGSMFQQAFYGGDKCRVSRLASAVKSALHWIIVEAAVHSALQAIYRGAIVFSEHNRGTLTKKTRLSRVKTYIFLYVFTASHAKAKS